jgi:hypothetical protein
MPHAEYQAKIAALVKAEDYAGAAAMQYQQRMASESVDQGCIRSVGSFPEAGRYVGILDIRWVV